MIERLWDGAAWTDNTRALTPPVDALPGAQVPTNPPDPPITDWPADSPIASPMSEDRPKTNMVWAVIALIVFCLPLGLVGVTYASNLSNP